MSNLNFDDVSKTLDRLSYSFEANNSSLASFFQNTQISTPLSAPISDFSLVASSYSFNTSYDQDIFSELPVKVFNDSYNKQIAGYIKCLRNEYYKIISEHPNKILPKLKYYFDEHEFVESIRLASEWSDGNAMLYFSFEKEPTDSSFGLIWNDNKGRNYQTRSGNLYLNKMSDIVHETIEFIFRVY